MHNFDKKRGFMIENKKEKYWNKYAYGYDEGVDYVVGKALNKTIIEKLSSEHLGEVVEYGCGSGYFTKAIASNAKHIIATDISDEMLEMAKVKLSELNNVTIEKADCENSSIPSEKCDCVFMANLIHDGFVKSPISVLRCIPRNFTYS